MALAAPGKVTLHTAKYRLDQFQNALDDLDAGKVRVAPSSSPDTHAPIPMP